MGAPLAGVLGSPIGHSKSPLIHNYWIKSLKLKGLYVPIEISTEDLPAFLQMAPRLGFAGFNVTIPHKEAAAGLAVEMTQTARRAGSVNTIVFNARGEIQGDSTDGLGFLRNLEERAGWRPEGRSVAMLGAGGAARAVVAALLDAGVRGIRLANRSRERAEDLAASLGGPIELQNWPVDARFYEGADLLVNATSLGMAGGPDWRWELPTLSEKVVATDLIYKPLVTPFLEAAERSGARIVDGLGMLLHQAAPGFERWFGVAPTVNQELRDLVLNREGSLP